MGGPSRGSAKGIPNRYSLFGRLSPSCSSSPAGARPYRGRDRLCDGGKRLSRPIVAGDQGAGASVLRPVLLRSVTAKDVNRGAELEAPRLVAGVCVGFGKRGAKLLLFVFQSWTWSCQIPSMKNV
jgi:hypothetical protein